MAESNRDRRAWVPAVGPWWSRTPGLDNAGVHSLRTPGRTTTSPPTTVPPSPRSVGPRPATPTGREYSIVPRRRT